MVRGFNPGWIFNRAMIANGYTNLGVAGVWLIKDECNTMKSSGSQNGPAGGPRSPWPWLIALGALVLILGVLLRPRQRDGLADSTATAPSTTTAPAASASRASRRM